MLRTFKKNKSFVIMSSTIIFLTSKKKFIHLDNLVKWRQISEGDKVVLELQSLSHSLESMHILKFARQKVQSNLILNSLSNLLRFYKSNLQTHLNLLSLSGIKRCTALKNQYLFWYSSWSHHQPMASFNLPTIEDKVVHNHIKYLPLPTFKCFLHKPSICLLYTSDAADE